MDGPIPEPIQVFKYLGTAVGCCVGAIFVVLLVLGYDQKKKTQKPFDPDELATDGGKYVITKDGRVVEYFVWGSKQANAHVAVVCHGSAMTGKMMIPLYDQAVLEKLNVRCIAPSYPGHGYSDVVVGRRIADWPHDDLEPILTAENVRKFQVSL
jgi:hypothetical protein